MVPSSVFCLCMCVCLSLSSFMKVKVSISCSVVSDSLRPHGLQPSRLLCPWDSPGKNTGVGCHALLQGIVLTQGLNPGLLHHRRILCRLSPQGSLSSFSSLPPSPHKFPLGCWTGEIICLWIHPKLLQNPSSWQFFLLWWISFSFSP